MEVTSTFLGEYENNVLSLTFTPASSLPQQSGFIELEMPVWSSLYDAELNRIDDKYQWGAPGFQCSSPLFESMTLSESPDNTMSLKYENML